MATTRTRTWQVILAVGAVVLLVGFVVSGLLIPALAAVVLLLAMGGGALLYRFMGPPDR